MKALSIFLLVCFTMVLTPKQWWHHCTHTQHKKSALQHTDSADEDCPVCDLSLSVFTRPESLVFYVYKQVPIVHRTSIYKGQSKKVSSLRQLRAPPTSNV